MIYLILLVVIITCSAIMDASDYIAQYCLKKGWTKLYEWFNSDSWENKYHLQDWLIERCFQPWFAAWVAKDVLIIFTDGWHFFKAVMFLCMEYMVAVNSIEWTNKILVYINFPFTLTLGWYVLFLFLAAGQLFNIIYYKFRKL